MLGTVVVYTTQAGMPSARDLDLMTRMGQLAAIAIERRRAETALRDSEARYRGLFENVVEGVFQSDENDRIVSANPALLSMLGLSSLEALSSLSRPDRCTSTPVCVSET